MVDQAGLVGGRKMRNKVAISHGAGYLITVCKGALFTLEIKRFLVYSLTSVKKREISLPFFAKVKISRLAIGSMYFTAGCQELFWLGVTSGSFSFLQ